MPGRNTQGFTLIEVLVVVVIVGILITMATLTLGGRSDEAVREESERLTALIGLALEESVFQSREFALSFWRGGYAFHELVGQDWVLLEGDSMFRPRRLEDGLRLELYLEGIDTTLSLVEKHEPQVFLFSSGEISPFEVVIEDEYRDASWTLEADILGNVHAEPLPQFGA